MKLTLNNVGIKKTVNVTITNHIARNALQVAKTANASEAADSEDVALSGQISMIGEVIDFLADVFKLNEKQIDRIWDAGFVETQNAFADVSAAIFGAQPMSPTEEKAKK